MPRSCSRSCALTGFVEVCEHVLAALVRRGHRQQGYHEHKGACMHARLMARRVHECGLGASQQLWEPAWRC